MGTYVSERVTTTISFAPSPSTSPIAANLPLISLIMTGNPSTSVPSRCHAHMKVPALVPPVVATISRVPSPSRSAIAGVKTLCPAAGWQREGQPGRTEPSAR
jgi:hypothetical protein